MPALTLVEKPATPSRYDKIKAKVMVLDNYDVPPFRLEMVVDELFELFEEELLRR